tara:strand:+ start:30 stop:593 length:564 start_codon:yes stop_codon:yes gene_type:complete
MSLIPFGFWAASGAGGGAGAYDLLETTTLSTSASSVTFSGLGSYSDYKHLQIRALTRTDNNSALDNLYVQLNGDSGANYAKHELYGNGSGVVSYGSTNYSQMTWLYTQGANETSGVYSPAVFDLLDFSSTTKNTTLRGFSAWVGGTKRLALQSGVYINTDAITSITFTPHDGNNIVAGNRFSIYGVK